MTCPYCHLKVAGHVFRTPAQRKYIYAVCEKFDEVIHSDSDGETVIDMDVVAAAVASEEKPANPSLQDNYAAALNTSNRSASLSRSG